MTASDFAAWIAHMRETRGWTQRRCAAEIGTNEGQIARWKRYDPPEYIGLACAAVAAGLPAWPEAKAKRREASRGSAR